MRDLRERGGLKGCPRSAPWLCGPPVCWDTSVTQAGVCAPAAATVSNTEGSAGAAAPPRPGRRPCARRSPPFVWAAPPCPAPHPPAHSHLWCGPRARTQGTATLRGRWGLLRSARRGRGCGARPLGWDHRACSPGLVRGRAGRVGGPLPSVQSPPGWLAPSVLVQSPHLELWAPRLPPPTSHTPSSCVPGPCSAQPPARSPCCRPSSPRHIPLAFHARGRLPVLPCSVESPASWTVPQAGTLLTPDLCLSQPRCPHRTLRQAEPAPWLAWGWPGPHGGAVGCHLPQGPSRAQGSGLAAGRPALLLGRQRADVLCEWELGRVCPSPGPPPQAGRQPVFNVFLNWDITDR